MKQFVLGKLYRKIHIYTLNDEEWKVGTFQVWDIKYYLQIRNK